MTGVTASTPDSAQNLQCSFVGRARPERHPSDFGAFVLVNGNALGAFVPGNRLMFAVPAAELCGAWS